jgi:tetratricopeptide (TPR) repeat protein
MSVTVFLSTVSDEFRAYRDQLNSDLTRRNVHVKVQEDFKDYGNGTLDGLDLLIADCDAVLHLVGDMTGAETDADHEQGPLLCKHADMAARFAPLEAALAAGERLTYTQWEAWLALYHGKKLLIAKAAPEAPRAAGYAPTEASRTSQIKHLARLAAVKRFPGCVFTNADSLSSYVFSSGILDLLVEDYAKEISRARDVAEGFILEMAGKVAGDRSLDFEGMKQAVRNAIEIYEKEIAGGLTQSNCGDIVDAALAKAKAQADKGQSGLARATLRKAAEEMRREEQERRATYVEGMTALYNRERDIALASYDGVAAAEAIAARVQAVQGADRAGAFKALKTETNALYDYGRDRGSNVHLVAMIALSRKLLDAASTLDERGAAYVWLGTALSTLGERESGTGRLEEAVAAYRAALTEWTRERVPLDWAMTQNNLGTALSTLGARESGTARLEEAVAAYRAALEEKTRERVPHLHDKAQQNLTQCLILLKQRRSPQ